MHSTSIPHWVSILFAVSLFGCASSKHHYDPCEEWKKEQDEIVGIEKQLIRTEKKIQTDRDTKDTVALNAMIAKRDLLLENRKDAQEAATNVSYQCQVWLKPSQPIDDNPDQDLEERKRKSGW